MFCDAFRNMDRKENFTYEGKRALFDYLEKIEEETGEKIELDVIALCCDYSEDLLEEVLENYSLQSLKELQENTYVVNYDEETGIVLYQQFLGEQ